VGGPGRTADGTLPWLWREFDENSTKLVPPRHDVYYSDDDAEQRVVVDHFASGRSRTTPQEL
jgi:hypothetical protein